MVKKLHSLQAKDHVKVSRNCNAIDYREPIDYPEVNIMPSEQEWKIDLMNWDAGDAATSPFRLTEMAAASRSRINAADCLV